MAKKKKRLHGEGTIYQRPDGKWVAQAIFGRNDEGRMVRRSILWEY